MANIRVATNESWKDKGTGAVQERTEWHHVVCFGRLAEIVQQYLRKGPTIDVEGKLRTRKWQTQEGQERYITDVVVDAAGSLQMLDSRGRDEGPMQNAEQKSGTSSGYGQDDPFIDVPF